RGLKAGEDFFLAFSPERIDPGNQRYTLKDIPKVVGGLTPACRELATTLYTRVTRQIVPVSGPGTAEMIKLFENTFRSVNIALVNEFAIMCRRLAQRPRPRRPGCPHPRPRCGLQGQRRRHPRLAGNRNHPESRREGCRGRLPRPVRAVAHARRRDARLGRLA